MDDYDGPSILAHDRSFDARSSMNGIRSISMYIYIYIYTSRIQVCEIRFIRDDVSFIKMDCNLVSNTSIYSGIFYKRELTFIHEYF